MPPGRALERVAVELGLLPKPAVEEGDDFEDIPSIAALQPGLVAALGQRLDHQRVELGVLRLLDPVTAQQVGEQRVEPRSSRTLST